MWRNPGAGTVYPVVANPSVAVASAVNADEHLNLICASQGANTLTVLANNGLGGFTAAMI